MLALDELSKKIVELEGRQTKASEEMKELPAGIKRLN